jgi:hypothetical protein
MVWDVTTLGAWVRKLGNDGAVANAASACRARHSAERAAELALRRIGTKAQPYRTRPLGEGTKSAARR